MNVANAYRLEALTPALVCEIEDWFDDCETQRYLGGREWIRRELDLIVSQPGTEFRGSTVIERLGLVARDRSSTPVAFVTIEVYDDATAGIAFVVAPTCRGRGVARGLLSGLLDLPELWPVKCLTGAVEPENIACRRALAAARFTIASIVDDEGMLRVERERERDGVSAPTSPPSSTQPQPRLSTNGRNPV